jgi:hypothetical protein
VPKHATSAARCLYARRKAAVTAASLPAMGNSHGHAHSWQIPHASVAPTQLISRWSARARPSRKMGLSAASSSHKLALDRGVDTPYDRSPSATSPTNGAGSSARRAAQLSACSEGSTQRPSG